MKIEDASNVASLMLQCV